MGSLHVLPKPEPDKDVIECCETLLKCAKRGEIRSISAICIMSTNSDGTGKDCPGQFIRSAGTYDRAMMLYAIKNMELSLLNRSNEAGMDLDE